MLVAVMAAVISIASAVLWIVFGIFFLTSVHADGFVWLVVLPLVGLAATFLASIAAIIVLWIRRLYGKEKA